MKQIKNRRKGEKGLKNTGILNFIPYLAVSKTIPTGSQVPWKHLQQDYIKDTEIENSLPILMQPSFPF